MSCHGHENGERCSRLDIYKCQKLLPVYKFRWLMLLTLHPVSSEDNDKVDAAEYKKGTLEKGVVWGLDP